MQTGVLRDGLGIIPFGEIAGDQIGECAECCGGDEEAEEKKTHVASGDARADQGGHSAGDAVVAAMGEKFVRVSKRAAVGLVDLRLRYAGSQNLEAAGLAEINVAFSIISTADRSVIAECG
jgi:hypothetical protein